MILCDIGNTNATFCIDGKISRVSIDKFNTKSSEQVYFINVNENLKHKLANAKNFTDLEPFFTLDTVYEGLGVDRIAACYGINDGVIVDAGSAITVDIMSNGMHLGGYILPGIAAQLKLYAQISPRLNIALNSQIKLNELPQKTRDAVSYGIIKPIVCVLSNIVKSKNIYFTGGDGEFLSKFFDNCVYDKMLIFRSMQRLITNKGIK
ncbi:MAG: type III pantothenate kinase [Campylobacter sp.]|nr:type III pantothenate kinase [Campylobacter sp.]